MHCELNSSWPNPSPCFHANPCWSTSADLPLAGLCSQSYSLVSTLQIHAGQLSCSMCLSDYFSCVTTTATNFMHALKPAQGVSSLFWTWTWWILVVPHEISELIWTCCPSLRHACGPWFWDNDMLASCNTCTSAWCSPAAGRTEHHDHDGSNSLLYLCAHRRCLLFKRWHLQLLSPDGRGGVCATSACWAVAVTACGLAPANFVTPNVLNDTE